MKRRGNTPVAPEPDMPLRAGEIRMPARSGGHDARQAREVRA